MGTMQRQKRAVKEYNGKARIKVLRPFMAKVTAAAGAMRAIIAARGTMIADVAHTSATRGLLSDSPEWGAPSGALLLALNVEYPPARTGNIGARNDENPS